MQKMLSYVRRAVDHYHMIEDGDRIAVGVSGGKDSLALLVALAKLRAQPRPRVLAAGYADRDTVAVLDHVGMVHRTADVR